MVDVKFINAPGTPKAGPYTHAVRAGTLIFISGQGPAPGATDIKDQTQTTFENVKKILEVAGAKVLNIVKCTVYLKNMKDFGKMNRTYQKFFEENGVTEKFPARTTIEVSNLPLESMLIEIDAIAAI
jgi:2-iminobutanoate/2-iminopropanoate deaminase